MKLSVIIVSYNVRYFLEQCLQSVQRAADNLKAYNASYETEVWVVDNNSSDGSAELVNLVFPWVKLIANKDNKGFSAANNQAILQSAGEHVLLLNPDTVVSEDTFAACMLFMDEH